MLLVREMLFHHNGVGAGSNPAVPIAEISAKCVPTHIKRRGCGLPDEKESPFIPTRDAADERKHVHAVPGSGECVRMIGCCWFDSVTGNDSALFC